MLSRSMLNGHCEQETIRYIDSRFITANLDDNHDVSFGRSINSYEVLESNKPQDNQVSNFANVFRASGSQNPKLR